MPGVWQMHLSQRTDALAVAISTLSFRVLHLHKRPERPQRQMDLTIRAALDLP